MFPLSFRLRTGGPRRCFAAGFAAVALVAAVLPAWSPAAPVVKATASSTMTVTSASTTSTAAVQVWITTPDARLLLSPQSPVAFATDLAQQALLTVDDRERFQQVLGFGAALTDASAIVLRRLSPEARAEVLRRLFSRTDGIGLSIVRKPIGSTDFSVRHATYWDGPFDCAQADDGSLAPPGFSTQADEADVLPVLAEIRAVNPALRLMAAPWSAPAWMKTGGSLYGGRLRPECMGPYAGYLAAFVHAYAARGFPPDDLSVQNEPRHAPADYPGMLMDPDEQARFVRDHLGPRLQRSGLQAAITIWDHNWDGADFPLAVLSDPLAAAWVAATAFHGYAGQPAQMAPVASFAPDKAVYVTEISAGGWSTDFGANLQWDVRELLIGSLSNAARAVVKWNLALDDAHGPHLGGCNDCNGLVTVPRDGGPVRYNYDYYALGHLSKFVQRQAFRIATRSDADLPAVAFRNPDNGFVLLVLNGWSKPREITLRWRDGLLRYRLPAGAVATFVWPGA